MKRLILLFHTVRHLKPCQVYYRIYYRLRALRGTPVPEPPSEIQSGEHQGPWQDPIPRYPSLQGDSFHFIGLGHCFGDSIDWNFADHGRLWSYNLNYFDFLNQQDCDRETGLSLVRQYLNPLQQRKVGMEPYPTSLRIINWIKFLVRHKVRDSAIETALLRQALHLRNHLEYHLLGNHLLENGFALLCAAAWFPDAPFAEMAAELVLEQLDEQILDDGAHFERSAMYHQIILDRLLDTINILRRYGLKPDLLPKLEEKAAVMLGWLSQICFLDGSIPLVNDAAPGIAPGTPELFQYAGRLGIEQRVLPLRGSGYRVFKTPDFEMLIDVGAIGPEYIPGHAHSDTFNFLLNVSGKPVLVDSGTSTYQDSPRRRYERSTAAHNTVEVAGLEQSEVWGAFRVARRARVHDLSCSADALSAWHDGYLRIGSRHRRSFKVRGREIVIEDEIFGYRVHPARALFHFHPEVAVALNGDSAEAGSIRLFFTGQAGLKLSAYDFGKQFNNTLPAQVLEVQFSSRLQTRLEIIP